MEKKAFTLLFLILIVCTVQLFSTPNTISIPSQNRTLLSPLIIRVGYTDSPYIVLVYCIR